MLYFCLIESVIVRKSLIISISIDLSRSSDRFDSKTFAFLQSHKPKNPSFYTDKMIFDEIIFRIVASIRPLTGRRY